MHIFLDTMIYLHCVDIESIDFPGVLNCDSATIVVPRITIRELDGHKTNHKSRIRNRARSALTKIESLVSDSKPVRPNVNLQLMDGLPNVDFAELGLDPNWNDDQMIASALTFAKQHNATVTVITHDIGARLKCTQIGLNAISLPEKYQLPEEPDPLEDEIRKLKQQLQRLESAMPKLAVYFAGTTEYKGRFQLEPPLTPDESAIRSAIEDACAVIQEIKLTVEGSTPSQNIAGIPQSEVARFYLECEEYPSRIEAFELAKVEFGNQVRRAFVFRLEVCNFGSAPANDVDINLHFPDGFQLLELDDFPKVPGKPPLPTKPRTQLQITLSQFADPSRFIMPNLHLPNYYGSTFSLKRTNSYELTEHFHNIKHGESGEFPELLLMFDTVESARSFNCDYELRVANLPEKVIGQVHFIVETKPTDGE